MEKIIIHCRKVYPGHVTGKALVSPDGIGAWGSIEEKTGIITERGHAIFGKSIKDTILVFPYAKGSAGWGKSFQNIGFFRSNPKAMLVEQLDSRSALGIITSRTPAVTDFDQNPLDVIETGDLVEVNADDGLVIVTKQD